MKQRSSTVSEKITINVIECDCRAGEVFERRGEHTIEAYVSSPRKHKFLAKSCDGEPSLLKVAVGLFLGMVVLPVGLVYGVVQLGMYIRSLGWGF
jgi:hypothetical protein